MKILATFQLMPIFIFLIVQGQTQTTTSKTCTVNNTQYFEGHQLQINVGQGCSFNCTCTIQDGTGIFRNCIQQCEEFIYPTGCEPQRGSGRCGCYTSYICPQNTCHDENGGSYEHGETFTNDTCDCSCIRGTFQCKCQEAFIPNRYNNGPCIPEENATCKVCLPNDIGVRECTLWQKCEQWPFRVFNKFLQREIQMTCTCYAGIDNYTKCVPNMARRSKRFATNNALFSQITFHSLKRGKSVLPAIRSKTLLRIPTK